MRSLALSVAAGGLLAFSSLTPAAAADGCKPRTLPRNVLRLVRPVVLARILMVEEAGKLGKWDPDSPASKKYDELFNAALRDNTPAGDQALAYLLTIYVGEHYGGDLLCEVMGRGKRMVRLVEMVHRCQPLTGLEPYPPGVQGTGVLPQMALDGLRTGKGCDE